MPKKAQVPDAWDDDWEAQVDNEEGGVKLESEPVEEPKLSKDELIAKHKEENKKVWQMAEDPEAQTPFHLLAAKEKVPLQQEFKPALKLLSRKPAGVAENAESEEDLAKNKLSAEELRAKAQRDREEKQRKYEEVRAKIFGTDDKSAPSSPGNTTPPKDVSRHNSGRGRGRGRGGASRGQSYNNQQAQPFQQYNADDIRRPGSGQGRQGELFDPNYTPKPGGVSVARRNEGSASSGRNTPKAIQDGEIIRGPRGPDYNGRGGFNFGGK